MLMDPRCSLLRDLRGYVGHDWVPDVQSIVRAFVRENLLSLGITSEENVTSKRPYKEHVFEALEPQDSGRVCSVKSNQTAGLCPGHQGGWTSTPPWGLPA